MSKKNKIYWSLGVTEKGTRALLTDENSKFKWLRFQRNRRILVVLELLGVVLIALGSYYTSMKSALNLSDATEIITFSVAAILAIMLTLGAYSFLRIAVRGIADYSSLRVMTGAFYLSHPCSCSHRYHQCLLPGARKTSKNGCHFKR